MIYSSDLRKLYYTEEDIIRLSELSGVLLTKEEIRDTMEGLGVFKYTYNCFVDTTNYPEYYDRFTVRRFFLIRELYSHRYRPLSDDTVYVENFLSTFDLVCKDTKDMFTGCNMLKLDLSILKTQIHSICNRCFRGFFPR